MLHTINFLPLDNSLKKEQQTDLVITHDMCIIGRIKVNLSTLSISCTLHAAIFLDVYIYAQMMSYQKCILPYISYQTCLSASVFYQNKCIVCNILNTKGRA